MKPGIWCAFSGHGYGHLSQVAPILNHLGERVPGIRIMLAGNVDGKTAREFLRIPFEQDSRPMDVCLVQRDALMVDLPATRQAMRDFHDRWASLLEQEVQAMAAWNTGLLLADVPYLSIAAAHQLGIPSLAIASLSWDHVLKAYFSLEDAEVFSWWRVMRQAYAQTSLALYPQPFIAGDTFPKSAIIPTLCTTAPKHREALRGALGINKGDQRPVVLVNMGGIASNTIPYDCLFQESRYHWIFKEYDLPSLDHVHSLEKLGGWLFEAVVASVDLIVSKPGYGTAALSVALKIPMLYVRRGTFPDEESICLWLKKFGRAREVTLERFCFGDWHPFIQSLLHLPFPAPPPLNGAEMAADKCLEMLRGDGTKPLL